VWSLGGAHFLCMHLELLHHLACLISVMHELWFAL
jgi:hypothetical protein